MSEALVLAKAEEQLLELGLKRAAAVLPACVEWAAGHQATYAEFLHRLLETEQEERYNRYMHTRLRMANFPYYAAVHRSGQFFTAKHERVRNWAAENNVELVYTPTHASWLKRIDCHFGPLRKFVLSGSNHEDHKARADSIWAYICWRNKHQRNARFLREKKKIKVARRGTTTEVPL
ncbi:ATP-binding protein [Alicyclobacillus macrosporangiidus]|uniref:IstB-like ATP-binding domain-containing protein n=1 Tax=Alicyclobacillus macrosporangiidus TaxID=392015 RepID=A0A1I7LD39_9BACL|nr:ATP-binding protein [Alicyclobacillus macrosporangiidus]SFV07454.1 hypothetical protein SAMN05421543_1369 [Alicyclobacillus macrosporangiidus]